MQNTHDNDETNLYMNRAFELAKVALDVGEVPVGCVFVINGKIIASGKNSVNETKSAVRHAEFNCIDQVLEYCRTTKEERYEIFRECSVYVTVEPCIMCAAALQNLGVKKIIYGCDNQRFGGCGSVINVQNNPKTEIIKGVMEDYSISLLKMFYQGQNPNAPCPKIK
ncbi:tRNA-specific adenosine deaminase 2-like [Centruroides sculpturatus]|uniref:tRNA-specific adenosine deaminase 2-like n=1 Tax=Centruroides sculpturatus TaxID=218467 RepID=UPI000C6E30C4|nr:tRNA-specific adenosine deaminase 2-like [Centruroides sculpturatus]